MMDILDKDLVIPGLFSALSGLFGWLIGRKKENVEIQGSEITNVQEAIKIWREMATDMKAEVADLKEKVETLTNEIHNLRAENVELRTKLGLTKEEK